MSERTYRALEFDVILDMLSHYAVSQAARERIARLEPIQNLSLLEASRQETADAAYLIRQAGYPPQAATDGMEMLMTTVSQGGVLTPEELEYLARFMNTCRRMKDYLRKGESTRRELALNGRAFSDLSCLQDEIETCIRSGQVADSASTALRNARRRRESASEQLRARLSNMLRAHPEYYADGYVAQRGGRETLPVKAAFLRQVPGTVVERSQTGATVFVEPDAAGKLRGEIESLRLEEENEILRVLYALTGLVSEAREAILSDIHLMERLDFAFAKGKMGLEMDGVLPEITLERKIVICEGRHPLLEKEKAVPLGLQLEPPLNGMIITGPNTGGKTMALKTIGLFALMTQSGLMVCAKSAQLCPFDRVLADVGDGQSISENLSTFSAHMARVLHILREATPNSLVLMDELGSGTDPTEGMGLAVAVLEELAGRGCLFAATSHYPQIKEFARSSPAVTNARMKFNPETLQPLYALEVGEAGDSCALLIARRLGIPKSILDRAQRAVEGDVHCHPVWKNQTRAQFDTFDAPPTPPERALKFGRGDSVRWYPSGEVAIVEKESDSMGNLILFTRHGRKTVSHKRVKLLVKAEMLYPEDYDFSVVFDTVANRKARHTMSRKHDPTVQAELGPTD